MTAACLTPLLPVTTAGNTEGEGLEEGGGGGVREGGGKCEPETAPRDLTLFFLTLLFSFGQKYLFFTNGEISFLS